LNRLKPAKSMVDNGICRGYNTYNQKPINGSERKEYPGGSIREGMPRLEASLTEVRRKTSLSRSAEGQ